MIDFFQRLFDTNGFPPRWTCGLWSMELGWLHILSDITIFCAYAAIPIMLVYFIRSRKDVPFSPIFWLFALFIISCGITHFVEATLFWFPWYRLSGLLKAVTAVVSTLTAIALYKELPRALALPGLAKINSLLTAEIAERKQAVEGLRESEEKFRALADAIPQLAWIARPDGFVHWYNRRWYDYTGTTPQQMEGWGWQSIHDPEILPKVMENWKASIDSGEPFEMVFPLRGADGQFRRFLTLVKPLKNKEGQVMQWFGTNTDVEKQQRTEEALRKSEQQLRLISDSAPVFITQCDREHRYKFVNKPYADRFGLRPEDVVGRHISEVVGQEAYENLRGYLDRGLAGETVDFEISVPYEKWGTHYMACAYVPERDAGGAVVGLVAAIIDITERRQMEQAVKESEHRFRHIADAAPVLIWMSDTTKKCTWFNKPWLDFTGRSIEQEVGDGWTEGVHPDDRERCWEIYASNFDARKPFSMEYRLKRHDGEYRWLLNQGVPRFAEGGTFLGFIGSCVDIAGRKRAEEMAGQLNTELETRVTERTAELHASMNEMEAFSYSIAHDMRAPLRAINGYVQVMLDDYGSTLDEQGREILDKVVRAATRQDQFIRDILNYTRVAREPAVLMSVDLDVLLADIFHQYPDLQLRKSSIEIIQPLGRVMGHEALLTQVFSNLLGNALKFIPKDRTPRVCVRAEPRGALLRIWVEDNGIGIAEKNQERIFGIFERVHTQKEYGGSGIGLAIVHKAARRMGGGIGVISTIGEGSRFWIDLSVPPS